MKKTFYFLTGMPRSGNTLLASLLNQNPNIYVSPLSIVSEIMLSSFRSVANHQNFLLNPDTKSFDKVMDNIIHNYYMDIEKPIIIDRDKGWGNPENFEMLKAHISAKPKVICTVRPVLEILGSFINLIHSDRSGMAPIDKDMINNNYPGYYYKNIDEARCDWMMRPGAQIDSSLLNVSNLNKEKNKNFKEFVEYEELITNPKETLKNVYNFLEQPYYDHDFNNIIKNHIDNDEAAKLIKNTHLVNPKISKPNYNFTEILPYDIIKRYSGLDIWKKEK